MNRSFVCFAYVEKGERTFNENVFKNPDLTLTDLAAELKIPPNRLSFLRWQKSNLDKESFFYSTTRRKTAGWFMGVIICQIIMRN